LFNIVPTQCNRLTISVENSDPIAFSAPKDGVDVFVYPEADGSIEDFFTNTDETVETGCPHAFELLQNDMTPFPAVSPRLEINGSKQL